eukprot:Selendium_serpulae@DN6455_c1_g3_i1.p1
MKKPPQYKVLVWTSYGGYPAWKDKTRVVNSRGVAKLVQYAEVFPDQLSTIALFLFLQLIMTSVKARTGMRSGITQQAAIEAVTHSTQFVASSVIQLTWVKTSQ